MSQDHSHRAPSDHAIHPLIQERWSPYAFAPTPVDVEDLRSLFEAARWAASSYNEQPWRFIVATSDEPEHFDNVLSCLGEGNQVWARHAPVLVLGLASQILARTGKPNPAALHDLGLAAATLTIEATARGLFVHQMIGIVPERIHELFALPDLVTPLTALAIGHAASPDQADQALAERDARERQRRPLSESVFGSEWGRAAALLG